jgi:hypothetical protein
MIFNHRKQKPQRTNNKYDNRPKTVSSRNYLSDDENEIFYMDITTERSICASPISISSESTNSTANEITILLESDNDGDIKVFL